MNKPNLLYVFGDQWRASACGYAGNPDVLTPRLDAFARQAANCHLAIAASPVCTPCRASLLTGLYPHRHGLFLNDAPLDPTLPSIGKAFAAAGYDTAWVGKWHVNGHGRTMYIPRERRHGFDHFAALECTHTYYSSSYYLNDDQSPKTWVGYDAEAQTEHLCSWLAARDSRQPFCAFLSWGPPHSPYKTAPEQDQALYARREITLPDNVPEAQREQALRDLRGYYGHCTALDRCFGRLLDYLDQLGLSDNTIIVFTSDHGDHVGSHGLWDKQTPFDESTRVPFLIRGPGIASGSNETIISHPDHYPTLASLCNVPLLGSPQGRDLSMHLQAGTSPDENHALCGAWHTFGNWPGQVEKRQLDPLLEARVYRGIRDERWLYCEDTDGPWLLYDCIADPGQHCNLVGQSAVQAEQEVLAEALHRRLQTCEDDFAEDGELAARWGYSVGPRGTLSTA